MIKPTVMLNIVFENFIYLFIYLFICTEKKKHKFSFLEFANWQILGRG